MENPCISKTSCGQSISIKGSGTVVTGTLLDGKIHSGDRVMIYPQQTSCRVRGVQVHEQEVEVCEAGQRSALNLVQTDRRQSSDGKFVYRGNVIAPEGSMKVSRYVNAKLTLLPQSKEVLNIRLDYIFIAEQQKFCAEQFRCPVRKLSRGNQPMFN